MLLRSSPHDADHLSDRVASEVARTAAPAQLRWGVAAAVVFAAAVMLRVIALTGKALWFDETFSVFVAGLPLGRVLAVLAANEPHPPLHFLLLHAWIRLFGDGEAAVRAPSVIIGAGIVALTWLFGRRLIGAGPALLAAGFVALAPSQVAIGQEARMGAPLVLFAVASWWSLWEAVSGPSRGSRWAWIAYAVSAAAMLYTHYYGFFVLASHVAYMLWRRSAPADWRLFILAGLGIGVLFAPWLPAFVGQVAAGKAWPAHRFPLTPAMFADTFSMMTVGLPVLESGDPRRWTIQTVGTSQIALAGFVAALLLVATGRRRSGAAPVARDRAALLISAAAGPVVVAYAASLAVNVYAPRYLILIMPAIALLLASSLFTLIQGGARGTKPIAAVLTALIAVPNVLVLLSFYRQPTLDVFDWRRVSHAIAAAARPDDAIVFLPGFSRIPVNYYFRGPQPRLALTPDGTEIIGPAGARMKEVLAFLERRPRVWILTAAPVPPSVGVMVEALGQASYRVSRQEPINMTLVILLERTRAP